ncbi:SIP domain-containing protein [Streptomyces sp. NPDC058964]|uniref:SIP domain-containing protein n=1 Tax=Streptomyces sp. NPDC058964 TaxID=3346681 RepID=UPI0036B7F618
MRAAPPDVLKHTRDLCAWIACDTAAAPGVSSYVRTELGVPRQRVHALGYWRAT